MEAIPVTHYGKHRATEMIGWGDAPANADPVEQIGVKWALAMLAVLWPTLTLMLAPAVVAVISLAHGR
jgi:hypothetical protein